jgi:hypothetical protein
MPHESLSAIMSSTQFLNTTLKKPTDAVKSAKEQIRSLPAELKNIYTSLVALDRIKNDEDPRKMQAIAELVHVLKVDCEEWLEKKRKRKEAQQTDQRTIQVSAVHAAAVKAQREIAFKWNAYKQKKGASPYDKPIGTKSLDGKYQLERDAFVKSGKTEAPSARSLFSYKSSKDIKDVDDFIALFNEKRSDSNSQEVQFLRQRDRLDYLVVPDGDKFYSQEGVLKNSPMTPAGSKLLGEMYAMDRHGNLFVRSLDDFRKDQKGYDNFNHSSFVAGREVVCAGVCLFKDGKLVYVDNTSGHYAPSPEQLQSMLCFIQAHVHPLDKTRVHETRKEFDCVASEFIGKGYNAKAWDPKINTDWPSDKKVMG